MTEVFTRVDRIWRGLGTMVESGLALRNEFAEFDAERKFELQTAWHDDGPSCRAGDVLRGHVKPTACPAFGGDCTPEHPLGAPMVSTEGACAAYYRHRRLAATGDE